MILLEIILFMALGIGLGILAGLIPGLHPNTVIIIIASIPLVFTGISVYASAALIVSMAVTNTIVNFIPGIFLGAPDPDTCLSTLPGHVFLQRGEGQYALFLTVVGGVWVMVLTALSLPFLVWFIPIVYGALESYMTLLLLFVLVLLLSSEKKGRRPASLFVFIASGAAGVMLFSAFPSDGILFPALGGLFGLPLIITSTMQKSSLPPQKRRIRNVKLPLKGCVAGWLAGMFVGILPGTGSAQAGTLANGAVRGNQRDFMTALGGINTSNVLFSFIALQTIGKTRTGVAAAVQTSIGNVVFTDVIFIMLVALLSCFLAALFTLETGRRALHIMTRFDYRKLNLAVIVIMIALIYNFTLTAGMIIATLCTLLGLSCAGLGTRRMYLMGFVMVPTMLYFTGFLF